MDHQRFVRKILKSSYVKGVSSGYLLMLVNNLVSLWMIPYSLKFMTREEFSLYYIASDLILWLGIVNLGTSSVFATRVGQLLGKAEDTAKEVIVLVNTAFFAQCFFAFLIFIIGASSSFLLPLFFDVGQYSSELKTTFLILSFSMGATLLGQVFSGLLVASKQIHIDNFIQILLIAPRVALTILFLNLGYGILSLAFVNLSVSLLGIVIPFIRVRKRLPHLKISISFFERNLIHDFLGNGVWFSIGGIAGILILNMDRFVIGNFIGLTVVSNFIITQKLYDIASKIVNQIVNVSRPYFAGLSGRNDAGSLQTAYSSLLLFTVLTASFLGTLIFFVNKYFISIWVGASFFAGDEINLFMALNFSLQAAVLPKRALLAATFYKIRFHALVRFAEGIVNLLLSVLLSKYFGIAGVIIGSIISTIIFSNLILAVVIRRFFDVRNVLLKPSRYTYYLAIFIPINVFLLFRYNFYVDFISIVTLVTVLVLLLLYLRDEKQIFNFVYDKFFKKKNKNEKRSFPF